MRMGKGKGSVSGWTMPIKKGRVLIELVDVPQKLGALILIMVSKKLPMKTKIIYDI